MLIGKLAHSPDAVEKAMGMGVEPVHFDDETCRSIWEFMRDHYVRYKASPSHGVLTDKFPDHSFEIVRDPTEYVVERFIKDVKRRMAMEAVRDIAGYIDDDVAVGNIEEMFLERARTLSTVVPAKRVSRFKDVRDRIQAYHDRKLLGTVRGIPYGIRDIDDWTLGIMPTDYVSIVGWQGIGKSTLMQYITLNVWLADHSILFFSLEMGEDALQRKWDSMLTHLKYYDLKRGELTDEELARWEKMAEKIESARSDIIVIDDVGKCTVERVFADTVKYKPDLVCVDYLSLLHTRDGQSMWERVMSLTGGIKRNARTLRVPHMVAAQTNIAGATEGARLENVAYGRSIGQDSDVVIGLHRDEDMKTNHQMEVRLNKNRDGRCGDTNLYWDLASMEIREWSDASPFVNIGKGDSGS